MPSGPPVRCACIQLLRPTRTESGGYRFDPFDPETGSGGHIEIKGVNIYGLGYIGKQAAALEDRRNKNRERAAGLEVLTKQQTDAAKLVTVRKDDLKTFADLDAAIAKAEQERQQHQPAKDAYTANQNVAQELASRQQSLQKMQQLLETLTADFKARQTELDNKKQGFQPELLQSARQEKDLAHAFRAIDVGREEVTEHWYDQLFLISHDVTFTEITDQMIQVAD